MSFLLTSALLSGRVGADEWIPLTLIDDRACTADGAWCVGLVQEMLAEEEVVRPVLRAGEAAAPPPARSDSDWESFQPWSALARLEDGGFLAGVELGASAMYSGGGGQATTLLLYRLNADGEPGAAPVFIAPIYGGLLIRACFSEEDMDQRAGACHDEYDFFAELTLGPVVNGLPVLDYETTATAFPRGVSRSEDSLTKPPLTDADLVAEPDPECSFRRRFTFDAATGSYQPDQPLPDCSDYTIP